MKIFLLVWWMLLYGVINPFPARFIAKGSPCKCPAWISRNIMGFCPVKSAAFQLNTRRCRPIQTLLHQSFIVNHAKASASCHEAATKGLRKSSDNGKRLEKRLINFSNVNNARTVFPLFSLLRRQINPRNMLFLQQSFDFMLVLCFVLNAVLFCFFAAFSSLVCARECEVLQNL